MSLELDRRMFCGYAGNTPETLCEWRADNPDAPVAAERLGSGWMVFPGPGVVWGGCAGLGLDGPVPDTLFDRIDAFFKPRDHVPQILVSPYADVSLLSALARRDYVPAATQHVLIRRPAALPLAAPTGVTVELGAERGVIARGFADGAEPPPQYLRVEQMFEAHSNSRSFIARRDGVAIGGGRVSFSDGIARLYGASVLPEARGVGVQGALLRARISAAAEAGSEWVAVEGEPGGPTHRNALRHGFHVAYTLVMFAPR